jgi:hypothetical protein
MKKNKFEDTTSNYNKSETLAHQRTQKSQSPENMQEKFLTGTRKITVFNTIHIHAVVFHTLVLFPTTAQILGFACKKSLRAVVGNKTSVYNSSP